jgi:hypothetical protein
MSEEVGETACGSHWTEGRLDFELISRGNEEADLSLNLNPTFQLVTQIEYIVLKKLPTDGMSH